MAKNEDEEKPIVIQLPEAEIDEEYVTCRMCTLPYRLRIRDGEQIQSSCPYCGYNERRYEAFGFEAEIKGNTIVFHTQFVKRRN